MATKSNPTPDDTPDDQPPADTPPNDQPGPPDDGAVYPGTNVPIGPRTNPDGTPV